jgi:RNA polymerase sigma-70 factor (ECF subfamily)
MDTDEALFERLIRGDMGSFDRLYARFERPLFAFIRAQLGDAAEAEDVLHETFMTVLRDRARLPEVRNVRAWFYQVARNQCLNRARSRKRAGRAEIALTHVEGGCTPENAETALAVHQRSALLQRAVERLPAVLAELFRLRAAGMSYDEAAVILEVPVGTVKSRMHDLVKRLREEMGR